MRKRTPAVVGGVIALALVTQASSCDRRGLGDAPVGKRHESPVQVWLSPDTFMNIAAQCIGPNGVYAHTREAAPVIIANDPNCAEGGVLYEGS
jgi:hypothetical protein